MPQSDNHAEQKGGSSGLAFEFSADLSPEICIKRWKQAAINPAMTGLTSIEVQADRMDSDNWDFQVTRYAGRRRLIQVVGRLYQANDSTIKSSTLISGSAQWNVPFATGRAGPLQFIPIIVLFGAFALVTRTVIFPLIAAVWLSLFVFLNRTYIRYQERKFVELLQRAVDVQSTSPVGPTDSYTPTLEERKWATYVNQFLIWVALAGAGFIFSTGVYLHYRRQSSFVRFHALQAMLWQLIIIALLVLALLLANSKLEILGVQAAVFIMIADWILWGPCTMILTLVAGGKISKGQKFRYPVIGSIVDRMLSFER